MTNPPTQLDSLRSRRCPSAKALEVPQPPRPQVHDTAERRQRMIRIAETCLDLKVNNRRFTGQRTSLAELSRTPGSSHTATTLISDTGPRDKGARRQSMTTPGTSCAPSKLYDAIHVRDVGLFSLWLIASAVLSSRRPCENPEDAHQRSLIFMISLKRQSASYFLGLPTGAQIRGTSSVMSLRLRLNSLASKSITRSSTRSCQTPNS